MKPFFYIILLACSMSSAACQDKAKIAVTFEVKEITGKPIKEAQVETDIFDYWKSGQGFGQDVFRKVNLISNADGIAYFEDKSSRCDLIFLFKKEGFYTGSVRYLGNFKELDRWHPWNPVIQIGLKHIRKPIPLVAKIVSTGYADYMPIPADKAAYDLEFGDWISPYGAGTTPDIIFEIIGKWKDPETDYDTILKLSFSNQLDGILQVKRPGISEPHSQLKLPYDAPTEGYKPVKTWKKVRVKAQFINGVQVGPLLSDETVQDEDYFLRVRTELDEKGQIVSAHYAKVQDSFMWLASGYIRFKYYYNPTPNNRNLEFDPNHNLLSVKPHEKVTDP